MKRKPELEIVIGGKPGRGRPGRGSGLGSMDSMSEEPDMDDEGRGMPDNSVDMALEDAFTAVQNNDMRAFKEAMQDALDSLR